MMDSTQQHWLPLLAVIPFITAIFSMFGPKRLLIPGYMAFFILEFSGLVNLTAKVLEYKGIKYNIGGWETPLGIALYAGILTVFMLWLAYILKIILTFYALGYFSKKHHYHEKYFMVLWFFLFGSLNVLFLSDDIFNMYVGLELTGLSSVALIAAANSEKALSAALRYLYVTVTGSLFYLFGVAVIYLNTGTLDVKILAQSLTYSTSVSIALVMILTSLFLKTALFPFHFWLPPAHSNAITPVSAVLSALVIKATFYLIMRYLFEIMPAVYLAHVADIMLVLGSMAIIYGSVMSYRSERMKLLIAYSTVAQVGYLFLIFAICRDNFSMGFIAGVYHLISHAFAKTVFFMAAGNMLFLTDNDEIKNIKEMLTVTPATFFALAVVGFSLIGLPPSGGFISKWLLLQGAIATGNWVIVLVICTGSLLAAAYMFKVLKQTFAEETVENKLKFLPGKMEVPMVVLALLIISLGLFSYQPLAFLEQYLMGVV